MSQPLPPLGGPPEPGAARGQRGVLAAIACIAIFGVVVGMTHPLFALRLEAMGYSSGMIGLNGAMIAVASLTLAPFMPALIRLIGLAAFLTGGALLAVATLIAFAFVDDYWSWLWLRYVLGAAATALFIGSETWIVTDAEPKSRGRIIGLYATVLSLGVAAGPMILIGVGVDGPAPFYVCALLCAVCVAPVVSAWREAPRADHDETATLPPLSLFAAAPTVLGAVVLFGAVEFGVMALLPVWGVRTGLGPEAASFLLSVLVLGNVALQIPLGALADIVSRRALLIFCALVCLAASVALPLLVGETWRLWAMLFIWGGLAAGLYTVALAELGARYEGGALVSATSAMVIAYGVGALVGPLFAGAAMDVIDPHGIAVALGVMTTAYLGVALWRAVNLARASS
jgi:MFS family permease